MQEMPSGGTVLSRLSQFFWAVNAKKYPDQITKAVRYTDMDFTHEVETLIKGLRRKKSILRKKKKPQQVDIFCV